MSTLKSSEYRVQIDNLTSRISELEQENENLRTLEEVISRNTAIFEALIANSSSGIALTGPDRRIVRVVRSAIGYAADQVVGMPLEFLIHPEDQDNLVDCYNHLLNDRLSRVEFEGRFFRPDGSVGWLSAIFTDRLDDPNVQAIVCNYDDITERKHCELMLAEFGAVVEHSETAVFSEDQEGRIVTWNLAAEKIFGYSAAEIVGQYIWALVPPETQDLEWRVRERVRELSQPTEYRATLVAKGGSRIQLFVKLAPVPDTIGGLLHACWLPESDHLN